MVSSVLGLVSSLLSLGSNALCTFSAQHRAINPNKDISVYGYGTVAWKDRIDEWKRKQLNKCQHLQHAGWDGNGFDGYGQENDELPMYVNIFLLSLSPLFLFYTVDFVIYVCYSILELVYPHITFVFSIIS